MKENDRRYMQECIELAKIALRKGESPVGSIIVFDDLIIGRGIESGRSTLDITNHAEILAIRGAISNEKGHLLNKSKLYTTHEPCIMCSYVIRHHRIPHVLYGISVDFIGGFTSHFDVLCNEIVVQWGKKPKVIDGICKTECRHLLNQFLNSKDKEHD